MSPNTGNILFSVSCEAVSYLCRKGGGGVQQIRRQVRSPLPRHLLGEDQSHLSHSDIERMGDKLSLDNAEQIASRYQANSPSRLFWN